MAIPNQTKPKKKMNYHRKHGHFEMSTTGNVLAEILREVERAKKKIEEGDVSAATVYLEYIDTILDDACFQYGTNAVFGNLEISKLLATD
jgi:hypothetical protein